MKKVKRMLAMCLACVLLVSAMTLPASAASASATLRPSSTSITTSILGLYNSGYCSLTTYTSSKDGVNLYLDQSAPGKGWSNAKHLMVNPGGSDTSTVAGYNDGRSWRGVLNSWWPGGTGCYAKGTITCYDT